MIFYPKKKFEKLVLICLGRIFSQKSSFIWLSEKKRREYVRLASVPFRCIIGLFGPGRVFVFWSRKKLCRFFQFFCLEFSRRFVGDYLILLYNSENSSFDIAGNSGRWKVFWILSIFVERFLNNSFYPSYFFEFLSNFTPEILPISLYSSCIDCSI